MVFENGVKNIQALGKVRKLSDIGRRGSKTGKNPDVLYGLPFGVQQRESRS